MAEDRTSQKKPATYNPSVLSEEEKDRFLAALGDGFGYSRRGQNLDEAALPSEVEGGLLKHRAYYDRSRRSEQWDDDKEDEDEEFWEQSDGDSPPGLFEQCPINFHLPALREYFQGQKLAYLAYAKAARDYTWLDELKSEERSNWEEYIYNQVLYKPYSKAWYEYHINQHFYFFDESVSMLTRHAEQRLGLGLALITNFLGTLGRLIEQYYWKFLVERAAIRGLRISESAKSGGLRLASMRKREHAAWQAAATLVWQEHPSSSKMMVASIVKKRLKIDRSAKHISRVLTRP
jgi:hypothetical protein